MTTLVSLIAKHSGADGNIIIPPDQTDEFKKALMGLIPTKPRVTSNSSKIKKDPNAPKRPTSAYMFWLNENRSKIKDDYFGDYGSIDDWTLESKVLYFESKGMSIPDKAGKPKIVALVTSKAGKLWKELTDEDKEPFEIKFKEAQEEYSIKKESYSPPKTKFEAPDGWTGPHNGMRIMKTLKDSDGKTRKFVKGFDEAIELANTLGLECYGITQTNRGFQVRIGSMETCEKSIASWTKDGFESPIKSKRGRSKAVVNEPEDTGDDDDDNSDGELEVDELEIDGTTYYYDDNTNNLYDLETSTLIGKYENGIISIAE
jgi:hypothetical protein